VSPRHETLAERKARHRCHSASGECECPDSAFPVVPRHLKIHDILVRATRPYAGFSSDIQVLVCDEPADSRVIIADAPSADYFALVKTVSKNDPNAQLIVGSIFFEKCLEYARTERLL
jgi:hypothetical protein